jgi:hypothetical protein
MDRKIALKRLSFIKYLFRQGNEQTELPEPLNTTAILSFHDAIELFLQLIAEDLNIKDSRIFMEYWELLNPKLSSAKKPELTQKENMRKLSSARSNLKHHGHLISKLDVEKYKIHANDFFEDNCKNIFNIEVKDISLIELVSNKNTTNLLSEAKTNFESGKIKDSVENLSNSFEYLIHDYEASKCGMFGESPFFFGRSLTFLDSFSMDLDRLTKMADFVDNVKESIENIQKAMKILCFGIDYKHFVKFNLLVPRSIWIGGRGAPQAYAKKDAKLTKEEFEFCLNFIIETALKLQNFDFEITK